MPIRTQSDLPAKEILERENIFVMDENQCDTSGYPSNQHRDFESDAVKRRYGATAFALACRIHHLQVDVSFMAPVSSHESKNTSKSHLNKFYQTFDEMRNRNILTD